MGAGLSERGRVSMTEKEVEIRVVVRTRAPHVIIDVLIDALRRVQHEAAEVPDSFMSLEVGSYEVKREEDESKN